MVIFNLSYKIFCSWLEDRLFFIIFMWNISLGFWISEFIRCCWLGAPVFPLLHFCYLVSIWNSSVSTTCAGYSVKYDSDRNYFPDMLALWNQCVSDHLSTSCYSLCSQRVTKTPMYFGPSTGRRSLLKENFTNHIHKTTGSKCLKHESLIMLKLTLQYGDIGWNLS
jgi:hypothetical protein